MSARRLGWIRVAIGIVFLVRTTPLMFLLPGLMRNHGGPLIGWPSGEVHFALFGLALPALAIKVLVVARTFAGVLFTIGVRARASGIAAAFCAYVVYSQEAFSFIFTLHVLYQSILLLACTDAVSSVALRPEPARAPRSSLWLIRAFVVAVYAWSAIAKLHPHFRDGSTLLRLRAMGYFEGPLTAALLRSQDHARLAAWAVIAVEAALVPLLLFRRTRVVGVLVGCALHACIEVTAHPDVLGWVMVALLASFFPDDDHLTIGGRHTPSTHVSVPQS